VASDLVRSQRVSFLQPKSAVHDDLWNVLIRLATSWNEFVGWNVGFFVPWESQPVFASGRIDGVS